jgi:molecular chaperone HscC
VFRNQSSLTEADLDARFQALAKIKLPPREQAENRALIARAERLYAEALGATREQILHLLRQFEVALEDQRLRDASALRREFATALAQFERSAF